jgi:hypothetical protein
MEIEAATGGRDPGVPRAPANIGVLAGAGEEAAGTAADPIAHPIAASARSIRAISLLAPTRIFRSAAR